MKVSDINTNTHPTDKLKSAAVHGAQPAAPGRRTTDERREAQADRVEISDAARTAARSSDELSYARNALHSVPELSESRAAQITERIKNGYYNDPEVIRGIAERLGTELARRPL